MKRFALFLILTLFLAPSLTAARKWVHIDTFAAQTATGTLASVHVLTNDGGYPVDHSVVLIVTGSPTGCAFQLEGSTDNTNFFNIGDTSETTEADCTSSFIYHISGKLVRWVRPNVTTLSGGSSPSVRLIYTGQQR